MYAAWDNAVLILSTIWGWVHDNQTLVTGIMAIGAALWAATPVWRQLREMSAQTNSVFRAFLRDRIQITDQRRKWLANRLGAFGNDVVGGISYAEWSDDGSVNSHWAAEMDQKAGTLL